MLHLHSKLTCERKGTEGRLPHSIHAFILFFFFLEKARYFRYPEKLTSSYTLHEDEIRLTKKTPFILIFSRLVIPKSSGSKDSLNNIII